MSLDYAGDASWGDAEANAAAERVGPAGGASVDRGFNQPPPPAAGLDFDPQYASPLDLQRWIQPAVADVLTTPTGQLTHGDVVDRAGAMLGEALDSGAFGPHQFGDLVGSSVDLLTRLPDDEPGLRQGLTQLAAASRAPARARSGAQPLGRRGVVMLSPDGSNADQGAPINLDGAVFNPQIAARMFAGLYPQGGWPGDEPWMGEGALAAQLADGVPIVPTTGHRSGAARHPGVQALPPEPAPEVKSLLDRIAAGEGTGDAAARAHGLGSGYDATLGYGDYAQPDKPVSQMTLGEIDALQTRMLRNPDNTYNSSAIGRYQIVRKTLRGLKKQFGLGDDVVFTSELQDRLGHALLLQRGLNSYRSGRISSQQFQNNMAQEWASVADSRTGRSAAGQHLGTTSQQIQAAIGGLGVR